MPTNLSVSEDELTKRLDAVVAMHMPEISRSSVKKLIDEGKILVNGQVEKGSYKLHTNDMVSVEYDSLQQPEIPDIDLPILYEDDDCIVIDKPVGLLTHSKGAFNPEATVATFMSSRITDMEGERGGIVHRLDRATSGVMICAKNPAAQSWLQKQFAQRRVHKTYLAVIQGNLDPAAAIIDLPIERNPKKPQTFRVGPQGKAATTTYKTLQTNDKYSLLELKPQTGRTHQLRVHLVYLKHAIVGDTLYEGAPHPRLMLHAYQLEITLPNRTRQTFTAAVPQAFDDIMK